MKTYVVIPKRFCADFLVLISSMAIAYTSFFNRKSLNLIYTEIVRKVCNNHKIQSQLSFVQLDFHKLLNLELIK